MTQPQGYEIVVYEYPPQGGRLSDAAAQSITRLRDLLATSHDVTLPLKPVCGAEAYQAYNQLLVEFLRSCSDSQPLDLYWLHFLQTVARSPNRSSVEAVRLCSRSSVVGFNFKFLEPWLARLVDAGAAHWGNPAPTQFFCLRGVNRIPDQGGAWGASFGRYPTGTSLEFVGYEEVIWHEALHLFGVSEGYELQSKRTRQECAANCWMQYEPTRGSRLCVLHSRELTDFAASLARPVADL